MRLGELVALQWDDIEFHRRWIHVRRSRVAGKMTTTKNKQRRRLDMSVLLTQTLMRLRVARQRKALTAGKAVPPWVFLTPAGHPVDGDNLRRRVFYRLLEQAGLRKIRLHDLRHTYASLLIQQGESLAYVQQQLGHSSVQVTVDVYGHLIPGANRAAVDRLDAQPARNPAATSANPSRTRKALSGCKNWSRHADSNRGPADYESAALPAELRRLATVSEAHFTGRSTPRGRAAGDVSTRLCARHDRGTRASDPAFRMASGLGGARGHPLQLLVIVRTKVSALA